MLISEANTLLREGGCLTFLERQSTGALSEIKRRCPEGMQLLSAEAKKTMTERFQDRLFMLYVHPLIKLVQDELVKIDPLEALSLSGDNTEALHQAVEKTAGFLGSDADRILIQKYPLIEEYAERIKENFIQSQADLLSRLLLQKDEIAKTLFGGKPFGRVLELSGDAGDIHRHGQCVQRIVTDAGTCYYKPHDLSMDVMFHSLTERLFSDCTISAATVNGNGYGFVEELKLKELSAEQDPGDYYYHLGMLTALFHALGSTDMHCENIMAVGTKPAAIDLETLMRGQLSPGIMQNASDHWKPMSPEIDLSESVEKTCVLPLRIYKGGMLGVLYCEKENAECQPFRGNSFYSVAQYEARFLDGFRAGYSRILSNKKDMEEEIASVGPGTVRYVIRNTTYYYYMRSRLFRAEALSGEEGRRKVLDRLAVAYQGMSDEVKKRLADYDVQCLTEGDIPYYCSAADGYDLCGFDPGEVLIRDFWAKSAIGRMQDKLKRFSEAESAFEQSLIRASLEHAPITHSGPPIADAESIPADTKVLSEKEARSICLNIFEELKQDRILTSDGTSVWHSGIQRLTMEPELGIISLQADAAWYCSILLREASLKDSHPDAEKLAKECLKFIASSTSRWKKEQPEMLQRIPFDSKKGLGGLIRSLSAMQHSKIEGAAETLDRIIWYAGHAELKKEQNDKGGEIELLRELCAVGEDGISSASELRKLIRNCAEAALSKRRPDDVLKLAERARAFAFAYRSLSDQRYLDEAKESFRAIRKEEPKGSLKKPAVGQMALDVWKNAARIPDAKEVHRIVLDQLMESEEILRLDSLNGGNALTVWYLLQAAEEGKDTELITRAGRLLAAMEERREKTGSFIITPPGICSFFDASLIEGTTGIGAAAVNYLQCKEENR